MVARALKSGHAPAFDGAWRETSPIFTSDFRLCPQGNAGEIAAVRIWLRVLEFTT